MELTLHNLRDENITAHQYTVTLSILLERCKMIQ